MHENSAIHCLINELSKLPGIGRRTAERLAYYLLKEEEGVGRRIAEAILDVKRRVRFCSLCGNLTEKDPCDICIDPRRDRSTVCVVEEPKDIRPALERAFASGKPACVNVILERDTDYKGGGYV